MTNEKEFLSDSIIDIREELIVVIGGVPNEGDWNYSLLSGDVGRLAPIGFGNANLRKIVGTIGTERLEGVPLIELFGYDDALAYAESLVKSYPEYKTDGLTEYLNGVFNGASEGYKAASKDKNWSDAEVREMMHKAFYEGREVKRLASPNNQPIFKHPTYEGWLRDTKALSPKRKVPTRIVLETETIVDEEYRSLQLKNRKEGDNCVVRNYKDVIKITDHATNSITPLIVEYGSR